MKSESNLSKERNALNEEEERNIKQINIQKWKKREYFCFVNLILHS